tara:strand:- start:209 stop:469 length:261 start_codon:yes stop_codon:yes gene_type:complete
MINELKTIDILETAIDKIDDGKIEDAKDDLQTLKDELQNEVDQFDKWAEEESKKDTGYSEEHIKQMTDPKHNQWGVAGEPKKGGVH